MRPHPPKEHAAGPPLSGRWLPSGWAAPLLCAAVLRGLWLMSAAGGSFRGDEPAYVALGRTWSELGAYTGQWPPLHPMLIAACVSLFGDAGETAARVVLTLLSVWSCGWLMALASRAHSERAGRCAGWIAALYLPLLPFAHVLLSEGLTIALLTPACTLLLGVAIGELKGHRATAALTVAGAAVGLACLTKEASLFWLVTLTLWGAWALGLPARGGGGSRAAAGLRRAALFFGAAAMTIAPWSARASADQGSFQLLGRTAGLNAYMGWNRDYINFDHVGLDVAQAGVPGAALRARLLAPPAGMAQWPFEFLPNVAERNQVAVAAGRAFIQDAPGFFLRTRAVKVADLITPLSYMTRYLRMPPPDPGATGVQATGGYCSVLTSPSFSVPLTLISIAMVMALALLAAYGATLVPLYPGAAGLLAAACASTAPLALVVAMSRFRAPGEALLIVPAAAALASLRRPPLRGLLRRSLFVLALGLLLWSWTLAIAPVLASLEKL
ncbi:MAG: hypothetical protein P8M11_09245 [Planctomycetota bacterium]|nr:hypothetical protein [Planctomycetota bacterium]